MGYVTYMNRGQVANVLNLSTELLGEGSIDGNDSSTSEIGHKSME